MAHVIVTRMLSQRFTGGQTEFEVNAGSVRHVIRELDARFPGIAPHLEDGVAAAIDGIIHQDAFLEPVQPDSEVTFMPMLEGG